MMRTARELAAGQRCRVLIGGARTGTRRVVYESSTLLLEAPNWSTADELLLNGDGRMWRLALQPDASVEPLIITGVPDLNNDHVLAPDGRTIYLSANDGQIYAAPIAGGAARRITAEASGRLNFLHGVSPDGQSLAFIGVESDGGANWASANVFTISTDGTEERQLTFGTAPADGSEYSPDGEWIYFSTEAFSETPGHAQIARMRTDGSHREQLTFDERVNWFPHLSASGNLGVYVSFPPGTIGHPADTAVELRVVLDGTWSAPKVFTELFGGQGTMNVNSWSPDGSRFAYVDYPLE